MERARSKLKLSDGVAHRWPSRWLMDPNFVPMRSGGRWVVCSLHKQGHISVHQVVADELANHFHFSSLQQLFGLENIESLRIS
jgi:hypothetical protein